MPEQDLTSALDALALATKQRDEAKAEAKIWEDHWRKVRDQLHAAQLKNEFLKAVNELQARKIAALEERN